MRHSHIRDETLSSKVNFLFTNSWAPSTLKTYHAGINRFIKFCLQRDIVTSGSPLLPAGELTLVYFVAYLSDQVSLKTIKTYLAGVGHSHLRFNIPFKPLWMTLLTQVLRRIKRVQGSGVRERRPITIVWSEPRSLCYTPLPHWRSNQQPLQEYQHGL